MNQIELTLKTAETRMLFAIPNPILWSGVASMACAEAIEKLARELHGLQLRLTNW
ncbi:MAG: hypothetical protein ACKOWI_05045 [Rhodoluna sp.]